MLENVQSVGVPPPILAPEPFPPLAGLPPAFWPPLLCPPELCPPELCAPEPPLVSVPPEVWPLPPVPAPPDPPSSAPSDEGVPDDPAPPQAAQSAKVAQDARTSRGEIREAVKERAIPKISSSRGAIQAGSRPKENEAPPLGDASSLCALGGLRYGPTGGP